jgi:hypothetical protein
MMSASDLALTAGDTPDLPITTSAYVALLAPLSRALDSNSERPLKNAHAGDFAAYTSDGGVTVFPGEAGFPSMVLGIEEVWIERPEGDEPIRHAKKPPDVTWLDRGELGNENPGTYQISPDGKLGNPVTLTLIFYLLIDGIAEVVEMHFSKTALRLCGRGFKDMAQRLAVRIGPDGLRWVTGCTLGKFLVTSRVVDGGSHRWHVPKVALIGKLGEEGGPSMEEWRTAQAMRMAAKAPPPKPLTSAPTAPLVAGPAEAAPAHDNDNSNWEPEGYVADDGTEDIHE